MSKKKYKRRRILVDKEFQTKFVFNIYVVIVIFILLLGILLVYLSSREMSGSVYSKIVTIKSTKQLLLPLVIKITIIILVVAFVIVGARFLLFSHKIAGPMLRFKRCLNELKAGDLTINIRFRKKDELKDVAKLLTAAVKELNKRIKRIKNNSKIIDKILKKKKLSTSDINKLKESHQKIEDVIKSFKL